MKYGVGTSLIPDFKPKLSMRAHGLKFSGSMVLSAQSLSAQPLSAQLMCGLIWANWLINIRRS